ncbi:MAG TPA: hypothetical protein VK493_06515 [Bryobacteraceae bacterium]|nr:hypothetical protein [Bryobacteraceae bacterium]
MTTIRRRTFALGLLAPFAATAQSEPPPPAALKKFSEVSASLYAWDLLDEGCDAILDTLAETTGADSAYLVALMHHEKRPLTDLYYPHDARRKTYFPEDSRLYWHPHLDQYRDTKIKPLGSDREELKNNDWLQMLVESCRKRRWKTGAEVSHTVLDARRAAGECAFAVQRDIFGNRLGQLICPNNPDARNYFIALFTDLVRNYDLDYVQTCLIPFTAGPLKARPAPGGLAYQLGTGSLGPGSQPAERILQLALGSCFCTHCAEEAKRQGLDFTALRKSMLPVAEMLAEAGPEAAHRLAVLRASNTGATAMLLRHPEFFDWLKFRAVSFTNLFRDVHAAATRIKPSIDIRLNAFIATEPELHGIDLASMKPYLGSVRSSDYSEQKGTLSALAQKREFLLSIRDAVGDEMPVISAIGIRPKATPETVRQGVVVSSECGADGLGLGHFDGASLHLLRAIKAGMSEADAVI